MVLIICGGMSIDIVARSWMSLARFSARSSGSSGPRTSFSSLRFLTVCWRCQSADSHSSRVTLFQPGNRRQSGSANSRSKGYLKGWSLAPTLAAGFQTGLAALAVLMTRIVPSGPGASGPRRYAQGSRMTPGQTALPRGPDRALRGVRGVASLPPQPSADVHRRGRLPALGAPCRDRGTLLAPAGRWQVPAGGDARRRRAVGARSLLLGACRVGDGRRLRDAGRVEDRRPPSRAPSGATSRPRSTSCARSPSSTIAWCWPTSSCPPPRP